MVGMVNRKEADLGVAPFTITLAREEAIDFTFPYYYDPAAILIPAPGPIKKVTAFLDPFTSEVWVGILLSIMVLGPVMYVLSKAGGDDDYVYPHNMPTHWRTTSLSGYYWMLAISLFQQGVVYPMNSSSRVAFGAWITAIIALSCAYTGVLISFLTVPRVEQTFSSLHDLPYQSKLLWTFRHSSALATLFMDESAKGVYREVGAPFKTDDSDLVPTDQAGVFKEKSFLDFAIFTDYKKTGRCNLALAKQTFFPAAFGWIFQFLLMEEAGIFDNWKKKFWPKNENCWSLRDSIEYTQPLDIEDLRGPLAILSTGFLLAVLFVILECFGKNSWKEKVFGGKSVSQTKRKEKMIKLELELRTKGLPSVEVKSMSGGDDNTTED
ncbi:Glutamate receptor-like 53 [Homarus americanus]|uniref:Glutamate receptor-like 53 n=1 Tax=Homarus americanus TaxID=6706 RepID=A0A8J5KET3_HOMAM|nr:Glutamate receptor-like 53 [Homarus americanus]